jgi:anaerobic selenocysteine-containing dehydrogenase
MPRKVTRRDFLRIGAIGVTSAVLTGCVFPRRWVTLEPYVQPPEEQLAGVATWYASTCRQCPAGCGIIVRIMNGRALKIEGNPQHPLNQGKLCPRGQAGLQVLYNPDRLAGPVTQSSRGSRQFQPLLWNDAINTLSQKVSAAGKAVAVWGGTTMSGLLNDIFQRFTSAIGAPAPVLFDLYTALNSYPIIRSTANQLFGQNSLPAYDLAHADVILSFGSDFLGPWLSTVRYGVDFGGFRDQLLGKRGYLIQLEPRMSMTGAKADEWIPIRPGSEAIVAQAIAGLIAENGVGPADRVQRAKALAGDATAFRASALSDISMDALTRLAQIFATADHPLAIPGSTLGGQDSGAEANSAVQTLNIIAGTEGQAGGLVISQESPLPSLVVNAASPLSDAQNLIQQMNAGAIQVLFIHGANPIYELPKELGFTEALSKVPFVVSFAPIVDETAVQADLILPDRTYLESWGYNIASPNFGVPVVGSQQPVVTPVFDTRAAGDVILTIARGIPAAAQALPYADEVAFLKQAIGQLPPGAAGGSGTEVLYSRFLQTGGWYPASPPAPAGPPASSQPIQVTVSQSQGGPQEYPYYLHLYMTNLLSDGRGASQPWLQGSPDPMTTFAYQTWVELHPDTAQQLGVDDGDVVTVTSPYGQIEAVVYKYPMIRPDTVGIPMGEGHTDYGRYAQGHGANPMQLVGGKADATGDGLVWATLRVKIAPTGRKVAPAVFENILGVTEGFINEAFPG